MISIQEPQPIKDMEPLFPNSNDALYDLNATTRSRNQQHVAHKRPLTSENPHTIIITLQSHLNNPFLYFLHSHGSNEAVEVTLDKKKDLPSTTHKVIWNMKD
jgi:hypothetical protein